MAEEATFARSIHVSVWIKGVAANEDIDQEMYIDLILCIAHMHAKYVNTTESILRDYL